jgi:hypothetical protein
MKRSLKTVAVLLLGLAAAPLRAAPLDAQVPREALVYVGWAGAEKVAPDYDKSNLKKIVDASGVKAFVDAQLPKLIEQAAEADPNAPKIIGKLQTGLDVAWRHPTAFYVCPVEMTNPRQPTFRFGLVCDAGADAKTVVDLLSEALATSPPPPDLPVKVSQENGLVLLTFGRADTAADLRQGGGLAGSATFAKAQAQLKAATPALAMYVDFPGIRTMVDDVLTKVPNLPPDVRPRVTQMIETLGGTGLGQLAYAGGFEGQGWSERAFLGISGPRVGVLALFDNPPLSDTALAAVPKDAVAFSASTFDFQKLATEVRSAVTKIEPRAIPELERALNSVRNELGIDVEQDVIAPLGTEWVMYRAPVPDVGGLSWVLMNKLRDPAAFTKTLSTLEKLFNERSGAPIKVEKVTVGDYEVSALMFMQYNVAWTVRDGYLYVSTLAGMPGAITQVATKGAPITENESYKAVRAALPQGVKPMAITYSHPARLYPELRNLALGFLPLLRGQGIDIPMNLLPDPARVSTFMTPGGSVTWVDADGLHSVGRSAFPGADVLGGGPQIGTTGVAAAGLGVGALVPSLGRSREMAKRAADAASLRGISQAALLWSNEHNDQLPDHIARLVLAGDIPPKALVSKRSGTVPLELTPELEKLGKDNFAKFAEQVDEHCDFVYVGGGMKATVDASMVLAYEKPHGQPEGINVAFQDAHVEFCRYNGLAEVFRPIDTYRVQHKLPAIMMPGVVVNGGTERVMIAPAPTPARPAPAPAPADLP